MISVLTAIVGVFVVFAMSRTALRYRDGNISAIELTLWEILWAGVLLVVVNPNSAMAISDFLGIGRPIDIFVYLGMVLMFYLLFKLYVKHEELNKEITLLVQELAIRDKRK